MDARGLNRAGAIAGLLAVAGNVAGVAVLGDIRSAYRPDALSAWASQVLQAPVAASASGLAFTLGLVALAGWAVALGHRLGSASALAGAFVVAAGAVLNAAGTPAPLVVVHLLEPACGDAESCRAASMVALGSSLALDALFNLLLGIGLILLGRAMWQAAWPAWLSGVTMAAGVASMPVSLQVMSPIGADLLVVAGPLWLAAIASSSVRLWREQS